MARPAFVAGPGLPPYPVVTLDAGAHGATLAFAATSPSIYHVWLRVVAEIEEHV